jgi:Predicted membrane protein
VRWLLLKDLRILGRSPLLVALLVIYPVLVSALIGFALSRGPEKPRVALLNQVAYGTGQIDLGGRSLDTRRIGDDFLRSVDAVTVGSREEARRLVEDGSVLGAIIIPAEVTQRLQSGLQPAVIEVLYNAEDPVKARYLEDLVKSQVQDANAQLTRAFSDVALQYLDLVIRGGRSPSSVATRTSSGSSAPSRSSGQLRPTFPSARRCGRSSRRSSASPTAHGTI